MERSDLIKQIELARQKLYQTKLKYVDLLHPNVIKQSMILDELINEYNQAKTEKPIK